MQLSYRSWGLISPIVGCDHYHSQFTTQSYRGGSASVVTRGAYMYDLNSKSLPSIMNKHALCETKSESVLSLHGRLRYAFASLYSVRDRPKNSPLSLNVTIQSVPFDRIGVLQNWYQIQPLGLLRRLTYQNANVEPCVVCCWLKAWCVVCLLLRF